MADGYITEYQEEKKLTLSEASIEKNVTIRNRFKALSCTDDDVNDTHRAHELPDKPKEYKPPPVFLKNVVNYSAMIQQIKTGINCNDFYSKTTNRGTVKVSVLSTDNYRKLITFLNMNNVEYYTYQLKEDKPYCIVIRNIHHSVEPKEIKEALSNEGYETRNVTNIKNWRTKEPLSMFFVDLEPTENVKKIYELEYLLHAKVKVEPPRPRKEIIQCMRCQQFGHSKAYCTLPRICVRCGGKHDNRECTNAKTDPPKCGLCGGNHPANYRGCPVYKDIINSRMPKKAKNNDSQNTNNVRNSLNADYTTGPRTVADKVKLKPHVNNKEYDNTSRSYAEISASNKPNSERLSNQLEESIMKIVQQNSEILILLTKLVNKLFTQC